MKYTEEQYKAMAASFNSKSMLAKLIVIKSNPEVLKLVCDKEGRLILELMDAEANKNEWDLFFDFPSNLFEFEEGVRAVMELIGIKLY